MRRSPASRRNWPRRSAKWCGCCPSAAERTDMAAPIYLDNNATTACDPEVVQAMLPYFTEQFGNPSSMHSFGNKVGFALKGARSRVQKLLGAEHDSEVIFTSCGTESDSTAILSALKAHPERNQV